MNKKGFTLTELLIVVVILGIITAISLPIINNITSKNELKQFNVYKESLKHSGKLYVDSYEKDIFGLHKSGCYVATFDELEKKNLAKDIQYRNNTCKQPETFVKIVKVDDSYVYSVSLLCKENGKVTFDETFPSEGCFNTASIITINVKPPTDEVSKSKSFIIEISSPTGVLNNYDVQYAFSTNDDRANLSLINNYQRLQFDFDGELKQKEKIRNGKTITSNTTVITPPNISNLIYLVIKVNDLRDLTGDDWRAPEEFGDTNILLFGPYRVDDVPPVINSLAVVSSETSYNSKTPKLKINVSDAGSLSSELTICFTDNADTCNKTVKGIKDGNGYTRYVTEYDLSFDYKNPHGHKIYVTAADAAGNYASKDVSYNVAYQVTYHSNFDSDKHTYSYCNVGSDCTLVANSFTRGGYLFDGWNTKANGKGTNYADKAKINAADMKDLVLYAKWKIDKPIERIYDGNDCEYCFNPKVSGYYKLEVWGAQGSSASVSGAKGGYGGYSVGVAYLDKNATYCAVAGSAGKGNQYGYNGGGSAQTYSSYGDGHAGGGASHIATQSVGCGRHPLASISKNNLLIVAGGGGGAMYVSGRQVSGGSGGGFEGNQGGSSGGTGGTQTAGGKRHTESGFDSHSLSSDGSYGLGGKACDEGGGGGGLYGGGGSCTKYGSGGGGGSGYIGNSKLLSRNDITKAMYCYSCKTSSNANTRTYSTTNVSSSPVSNYAKAGDGHVRITFLSES